MSLDRLRKTKGQAPTKPAAEEPADDEDDAEIAALEAKLAARKAKGKKAPEPEPEEEEPEAIEAEIVPDDDPEEEDPADAETATVTKTKPKKPKASAAKPMSLAKMGDFGALVKKSAGGAGAALSAFVDEAEAASYEPLFPGIYIKGGDSGGTWDYNERAVPEDVADDLPVGRKGISCFVLDYRLNGIAWKQDYDDRSDGDGPAWSCAIPSSDVDTIRLLAKATKNYQFTKKADKADFDWDSDDVAKGPGRPVPTFEMLIWHPAVGLMTIRGQTHHTATARSMKNVLRNLCDEKGNFVPQPVKVEIDAETEKAATEFKTYALGFAPSIANAKEIIAGFQEYVGSLDGEIQAKYEEWITCQDNPVTDQIQLCLETAAKI